MKPIGLRAKLVRVFALQILLISAATLVGIYATYRIVNDVLIRAALSGEAAHYWALFAQDAAAPLPNTANLRGYLRRDGDLSQVPAALRDKQPGYGRLQLDGTEPLVHVSDHEGQRLYLVFLEEQVANLVFYFGIAPLSVVLLCIYGLLFFAYRLSQQAISPIVRLANYLEQFDFSHPGQLQLDLDAHKATADAEVTSMIQAVTHFAQRVDALVQRERTFTRDASHELRTPLAVIKGSLDLLERNPERPAADQAALARMRKTLEDMEALLQTLLLLARGHELEAPNELVSVNEIVAEQFNVLGSMAQRRGNSLQLQESGRLEVKAPPRVLEMLIGNLLRNAINYTQQGRVSVLITPGAVQIEDTGIGMSGQDLAQVFEPFYRGEGSRSNPEMQGHGLGLAIVKRITHQFGWPLSITSKPGEGTKVTVTFN